MNSCGKSTKDRLRKSKFLRNKRSFIFITVLCMGIGFAYLTSNLTITGNTSVSGNSWNIYFTNVQVNEDSVDASVVPTTSGTNTTSIDYTVTLDKPGDFYEFTVDAVNNGTIDAMIQSVNMTSLDTDVEKYLTYTATYLDGTPLAYNDVLKKNKTATYKVRVEFKKNISGSDLSEEDVNLNLTFGVNYVQAPKPVESNFVKLVKSSGLSDNSINFGAISSASNGRGLYIMNSTTEDDYPIYYYRGNVSNNNAKFAGYCWKIVRTTETGGTKLVYNGRPNASGECTNTTGTSTQLTTSAFNDILSPASAGYMYGDVYLSNKISSNASSNYVYGKTVTYENGTYTLSDTQIGVDETHHYTCFSSDTRCTSINYVYNKNTSWTYYIILSDGKIVEDAIREMNKNETNSIVKVTIDNWFKNTFKSYFTNLSKDYNDYLEDTVWCNDRSMNTIDVDGTGIFTDNGWKPNGGSIDNYLYYSAYGRVKAGTPRVDCPNKNDSFTVTESSSGNGALTYPVGLLTADEMNLAGGQLSSVADYNSDFYLYTNQIWWSMSPYYFGITAPYVFYLYKKGYFACSLGDSNGVRPSISLKPNVKIAAGGDGTSTAPYEFLVD